MLGSRAGIIGYKKAAEVPDSFMFKFDARENTRMLNSTRSVITAYNNTVTCIYLLFSESGIETAVTTLVRENAANISPNIVSGYKCLSMNGGIMRTHHSINPLYVIGGTTSYFLWIPGTTTHSLFYYGTGFDQGFNVRGEVVSGVTTLQALMQRKVGGSNILYYAAQKAVTAGIHCLALRWSTTEIRGYVDGELTTTTDLTEGYTNPTAPAILRTNGGFSLNQIRVYNNLHSEEKVISNSNLFLNNWHANPLNEYFTITHVDGRQIRLDDTKTQGSRFTLNNGTLIKFSLSRIKVYLSKVAFTVEGNSLNVITGNASSLDNSSWVSNDSNQGWELIVFNSGYKIYNSITSKFISYSTDSLVLSDTDMEWRITPTPTNFVGIVS